MSGWNYDSDDLKWYYSSTIAPTDTTVNVIDTLILDGWQVGNSFSKAELKIQFVFEAKQKDYVTWEKLGTAGFNFTTGT